MRAAILGSRGIPNRYGGFEQFAGGLAKGLLARGCEVFVYNSHNHPYQASEWEGVKIIHKYDPEYLMGLSGQFIYDLNCILDSRKRKFDIILQLGYTTNSVWGFLLPRKAVKVCNPDGMEWQRAKYPAPVKAFLKKTEIWAVKSNDYLMADSPVIRDYFRNKYQCRVAYAAYSADLFSKENSDLPPDYDLEKDKYNLLIARFQPDNNIETIIKGYINSDTKEPLLLIGNPNNRFGKYLQKNYTDKRLRFMGAVYDKDVLNRLRFNSRLYFHGHSAGGTNPSLLEAMASDALICAHDNPFNRAVTGPDALYFKTADDIFSLLNQLIQKSDFENFLTNNRKKIKEHYNADHITEQYFSLFKKLLDAKQNK